VEAGTARTEIKRGRRKKNIMSIRELTKEFFPYSKTYNVYNFVRMHGGPILDETVPGDNEGM